MGGHLSILYILYIHYTVVSAVMRTVQYIFNVAKDCSRKKMLHSNTAAQPHGNVVILQVRKIQKGDTSLLFRISLCQFQKLPEIAPNY